MTSTHPTTYLNIMQATAPKVGQKATGGIQFALLKNSDSTELFITMLGNDGGGYFSREIIPFSAIESCLAASKANKPIPAKTLRSAFQGKSSNNAGFLACVLRKLGLFVSVPSSHQHQLGEDWQSWKSGHLAMPGEPFATPSAASPPDDAQATTPEPAPSVIPQESAPLITDQMVLDGKRKKRAKEKPALPTHPNLEFDHACPA